MPVAVHTRRIVDPEWAAKFSGTTGKLNFAVLAANDKAPGQILNGETLGPVKKKKSEKKKQKTKKDDKDVPVTVNSAEGENEDSDKKENN